MHASESLLSNNALVSELLHLLVRQFSEVESVGMESTQYRQYIVQIIRLLWNDPRCSQTVIDMKNEPEVIQLFVQTLISSFSKLTDDAFAAIPEIKSLQSLMLQPDFMQLDPKERDEKQLRLTQLEQNVRFSFDLTTDTLLLLLDAAEPWGVALWSRLNALGHLDERADDEGDGQQLPAAGPAAGGEGGEAAQDREP